MPKDRSPVKRRADCVVMHREALFQIEILEGSDSKVRIRERRVSRSENRVLTDW